MKEERFFGENLREAFDVIKRMFNKEVRLSECPFCVTELKITETMNRGPFGYYVRCPKCQCRGPLGKNYTEALELWEDRKE